MRKTLFFLVLTSLLSFEGFTQIRRSSTKTNVSSNTSVESSSKPINATKSASTSSVENKENTKKMNSGSKEIEPKNEVSESPSNKKSSDESFLKALENTKPKADTLKKEQSIPSISNSSAIANGQPASNTSAPVARVLKYKAEERSVEYYKELRDKFDAEEKVRKEKEEKDAIENAKREEAARQARHLNPEQAPQFDKYRNGATNAQAPKKSAEEEYNALFK